MKETTKLNFFIQKILPLVLLVLLSITFYLQTIDFQLTYLDDQSLIGQDFSVIKNVNLQNIFSSDPFFSEKPIFYRPILSLSFWLDYHLSGASLKFFHWHNILLNALAGILLFFFSRQIGIRKRASWFAAAIFSIHPVLMPAVAWLPGRNDLLLTVFVLASIISFIEFQKNQSNKLLNLHFFFWLLAMFSKENAIFLPLILIFFIPGFFDRKNLWQNIKSSSFLAPALTWVGGAMFYLLVRSGVLATRNGFNFSDLFIGIDSGIKAFFVFLGKFFWPFNLSTLPVNADTSIWPGIIIALTLISATWYFKKYLNKKIFLLGLIWFIVFLVPAILFQNNQDFGVSFNLEHRLYLPAIGLMITLLSFKNPPLRIIKPIMWLLLIGALILSILRIKDYSDSINFWQQAASSSPSSAFAHNNLGAVYYLNDRKQEALGQYFQALSLNQKEKLVHNNIGLSLMELGQTQKAKEYLQEELRVNPGYDNAIKNLELLNYYQQQKAEPKK